MSAPNAIGESVSVDHAYELFRDGKGRPGMRVEGCLRFNQNTPGVTLPDDLTIEALDLSQVSHFERLPARLNCYELNASNTRIRSVPADIQVETILNLSGCEELVELPPGLSVGTLNLRGCRSLERLPEDLDVWFLDLTGCWAFQHWPARARIHSGRLALRGCTALKTLPSYLGTLAALNVRDCPNLRDLPEGLRITGWIDVAQSGLAETRRLPESLRGVELRWQGVRIEERILLHPEAITVDEVLTERNAERRRVLIDRFGVSRFMRETKAEILSEDHDTGGPRQLLRLPLPDDEPLVTLSCFCPSTGRQYFLRVPPGTATCHEAAAWIAGFDNPDDYQPLLET